MRRSFEPLYNFIFPGRTVVVLRDLRNPIYLFRGRKGDIVSFPRTGSLSRGKESMKSLSLSVRVILLLEGRGGKRRRKEREEKERRISGGAQRLFWMDESREGGKEGRRARCGTILGSHVGEQ